MGLFDDFYFDPATYGSSQGLLGMLRASGPVPTVGNDAPSPLDTAQYPAGPMAPPAPDYGQTRTVQIGSGPSAYSLPIFGNPPAQNSAALPSNAQPGAGQLPQATQQASPHVPGADPSFGDRLQAGLNGFIANAHTGPIGAILGGIGGAVNGQSAPTKTTQMQNAFQALVAGGVPSQQALAAIRSGNADILKFTLNKYGKSDKYQPASVAEPSAAAFDNKNSAPRYIATTGGPKFPSPRAAVKAPQVPAAAAPIAQRPAQSVAPPGVREGTIATNPQTGEMLIRQNGKWVPFA